MRPSKIAIGLLSCLILTLLTTCSEAGRPFRGRIGANFILCLYKDSPTPARDKDFFVRMVLPGARDGHNDYWQNVSHNAINFQGSRVEGWYRLENTIEESKKLQKRTDKWAECRDKAKSSGYTPPAGHIVVAITSPGIDIFGLPGLALLPEDTNLGLMAHEVGHALSLKHSFSDDPNYRNVDWAAIGEYDDEWDIMSYAHVLGRTTPDFGRGGPGLNAYHRDRMGFLARDKIFRFGADGRPDATLTLLSLNRRFGTGYHLIRIPFDLNDHFRYYTVEYRVSIGWDSGFPNDVILIHEVKKRSNGHYASFLIREHSGSRAPKQSLNVNGVWIGDVSRSPATGRATVRIQARTPATTCVKGFVWRKARLTDLVCVSPTRQSQVQQENTTGPSNRQPGGGPFGPNTCRKGYVWREAFPGDRICVHPSRRTLAKQENAIAFERRLGGAVYGPNTCKPGYVWREADQQDWVCVTPNRRADTRLQNGLSSSRRQRNSIGCRIPFTWRDAFPNDRVCVTDGSKIAASRENALATSRLRNEKA